MYLCVEAGRQMVLHIALPDLAHGDSSGSVAYLKDARLERSLECRRREGENKVLLRAYAHASLRADGLSYLLGQRIANGSSGKSSTALMPRTICRETVGTEAVIEVEIEQEA
jgi:hypothetical protein